MNLANCSVQIYLIDRLLEGEFTTYGLQVLAFAMLDDEERHDPMVRIFPKVAKYYKSSLLSLSVFHLDGTFRLCQCHFDYISLALS